MEPDGLADGRISKCTDRRWAMELARTGLFGSGHVCIAFSCDRKFQPRGKKFHGYGIKTNGKESHICRTCLEAISPGKNRDGQLGTGFAPGMEQIAGKRRSVC